MLLGIVSIIIVISVTILVTSNVIKAEYYSRAIALIAFGLVYSITLLGSYVVGSDIQGELAASRVASGLSSISLLHPNIITAINMTSVVTMVIVPVLSRLLHMDMVWVYKLIIPLFLVAVPVIMYHVFALQIGSKRAFYAALFFIIMPVYNLQLTGIAKSMCAELFFALMILALVSNWQSKYKLIVITLCTVLAIISHYTIGLAMLAYLIGVMLVRLFTAKLHWQLWQLKRTPVVAMLVPLIISVSSFGVYYHYAQEGMINQVVGNIIGWYGSNPDAYKQVAVPTQVPASVSTPVPDTTVAPEAAMPAETPTTTKNSSMYLYRQEYAVQVGIGLDFASQPLEGKVFRIIQYATQVLIIIGTIRLLLKHKKCSFTAEFIAGIACSFVLLACCVFIPQFSAILNMLRFYQISLFFLAPMLVLGCEVIGR